MNTTSLKQGKRLFASTHSSLNHFLIKYTYVQDAYYRRLPFREKHIKSVNALQSDGDTKVLGSPLFPYEGKMMYIETPKQRDDIESWIQKDPYVVNNIVSKYSLHEYDMHLR